MVNGDDLCIAAAVNPIAYYSVHEGHWYLAGSSELCPNFAYLFLARISYHAE